MTDPTEVQSLATQAESVGCRFHCELGDYLYAQKKAYSLGLTAKMDKVFAVLLLGGGLYIAVTGGLHWWLLIFPLFAVLEWFNLLSISGLQMRIQFRNQPKYHEEYRVTFTDTGIRFKTASADTNIQWTFYSRAVETSRVYLLYYGKATYSVIPKRAFTSIEEENGFRTMLQSKISDYRTC